MLEKFSEKVRSISKNPEVKSRILFTFGMIVVFRFLSAVPLPGTNSIVLSNSFNNPFSLAFTLVTGGRLDSPSIIAVGLGSYISASFVVQLLQSVIKKLDDLSKEGARGRMMLNQITRFLTVPISIIQSYAIIVLLNQNYAGLFDFSHKSTLIAILASMTAGTLLLMWISEAITEKGIGNGSTIIIIAGIASILPSLIWQDITKFLDNGQINTIIFMIIGLLVLTGVIIFITEAVRNVIIQYSSRVRNNVGTIVSPQSTFPVKLNMAGVMPVIFAQALVSAPSLVAQFLLSANNPLNIKEGDFIYRSAMWLVNNIYSNESFWTYDILLFFAVMIFGFFVTFFIMFKPNEIAENFQRSGAFVPGIRPGASTAKYLTSLVAKLTIVGTIFLALLTVLPSIVNQNINLDVLRYGLGSTSLLIIVTGVLDTVRQINSYLVTSNYDGINY
ncbi:preprotein translocase subunit SecY [bacterium]|nr:MAG: preprotein translocase subunit SecY [bacterium]